MLRSLNQNYINILLLINNRPAVNVMYISKRLGLGYSGTYLILCTLRNNGFLKFRTDGREKRVELTEKGYDLASIYHDMLYLLGFKPVEVCKLNEWKRRIKYITLADINLLSEKERQEETIW